jgi:hypothetical protein
VTTKGFEPEPIIVPFLSLTSSATLYVRPGNWYVELISVGSRTLNDPITFVPITEHFPVPVQVEGEATAVPVRGEKKFGWPATRSQVHGRFADPESRAGS